MIYLKKPYLIQETIFFLPKFIIVINSHCPEEILVQIHQTFFFRMCKILRRKQYRKWTKFWITLLNNLSSEVRLFWSTCDIKMSYSQLKLRKISMKCVTECLLSQNYFNESDDRKILKSICMKQVKIIFQLRNSNKWNLKKQNKTEYW